MAEGVRAMLMRGGSSKGLYFEETDLPVDRDERDELLRRLMGSPDPRQIDGMGGAHPLTSKVAIVSPCENDRADIEYLFLQLGVDDRLVSDRQNCGNLLAGVGPFAIERGLVMPPADATDQRIRILMRNTDAVATATVAVAATGPVYHGSTAISGVPGTAAPIRLDFDDIAGGTCGTLLPTGNLVDVVDGVRCTLIDNGMPVIVMRADELGIAGDEEPTDLERNEPVRERLESIRRQAGPMMRLGDVAATTVPKLTMVSPPRTPQGALCTRTFIPFRCHDAIGVLGAVSVATAALLPGTPAAEVHVAGAPGSIVLEHPTGTFEATVSLELVDGEPIVHRAGIIRTARKLMDGLVYPRGY